MTKVVATVGPASDNKECVGEFVKAGMRIMRMNFSHANYDEALARMGYLAGAEGSHQSGYYLDSEGKAHYVRNCRATLLDTRGPEIRTGEAGEKVELVRGSKVTLKTVACELSPSSIHVDYADLSSVLVQNDVVLLDDGAISLTVDEVSKDGVVCTVENSGLLGARKGVNLPGKKLTLPAITDKDKRDLRFGIENDVDFVAQSFVRKGSDVMECKNYLRECAAELSVDSELPRVIAKIESSEALENFDEILEASDGIMVARGDLGVEIPFEKVTQAQKYMIHRCNQVGKPVIVATQMLESMQSSPRPTRAEVSDVINAIYDGADAVMLSGESANGQYPVESVKTMRQIVDEADDYIGSRTDAAPSWGGLERMGRQEAVCRSAADAAVTCGAKLIIVLCRGGTTARLLAKQKPAIPIMALCLHPKVARQLNIHRGVYPVVGKGVIGTPSPHRQNKHTHESADEAISIAKEVGWVSPGDTVVLVRGTPSSEQHSSTLGMSAVLVH